MHRFSITYSRQKAPEPRAGNSVLRSVRASAQKPGAEPVYPLSDPQGDGGRERRAAGGDPGMTHLTALNLYRYLHGEQEGKEAAEQEEQE